MSNRTEIEKNIMLFTQCKGQLEASIVKVEPSLKAEDFRNYCDDMYSCITLINVIIKDLKSELNGTEVISN